MHIEVDIGKNSFTERAVKHWTGCPGQGWSLYPMDWEQQDLWEKVLKQGFKQFGDVRRQ